MLSKIGLENKLYTLLSFYSLIHMHICACLYIDDIVLAIYKKMKIL